MLWRIVRRLLALGIRFFIWRPVVGFTIVAVALGIVGFAISGSNGPALMQRRAASAANPPTTAAVASTAPIPVTPAHSASTANLPPAVDDYLQGMTSFNAQLMWQSLDQNAIQSMESQGASEQSLQQQLDGLKQQGDRYNGVAFIGGYPLNNGDRYLFFVVSRTGFAHDAAGHAIPDQVFFVFTVGPNGKILKIE